LAFNGVLRHLWKAPFVREIDGHLLVSGTAQGARRDIPDRKPSKERSMLSFLRCRFPRHVSSRQLGLDRLAQRGRHGIFVEGQPLANLETVRLWANGLRMVGGSSAVLATPNPPVAQSPPAKLDINSVRRFKADCITSLSSGVDGSAFNPLWRYRGSSAILKERRTMNSLPSKCRMAITLPPERARQECLAANASA